MCRYNNHAAFIGRAANIKGGAIMAKYMIEETFSSQAVAGVMQKPEDRFEVLKPICEAAGCKLEQFYVSGIENKSYLIED